MTDNWKHLNIRAETHGGYSVAIFGKGSDQTDGVAFSTADELAPWLVKFLKARANDRVSETE